MINKIRKLISKFKKQKGFEDTEDFEEIEGEFDGEFEGEIDESSFYQDEDITSEVYVNNQHEGDLNQEPQSSDLPNTQLDSSPSDNTLTNEISNSIDLDQKLSWKDALHIKYQRLKDFFGRLNPKNFRNIKLNSNEKEESLTTKISEKLNLEIPSSVQSIEKKIKTFNLHNFYNELFLPSRRTLIHKLFQMVVILSGLFLLTNSLSKLLMGKKDYKMSSRNQAVEIDRSNELTDKVIMEIKTAKVFQTEKSKPIDPQKNPVSSQDQVLICKKASKKTSLPIKLINTIVLQDTVKSIASVQVRSTPPLSVREGDKIDNLAEVGKIDRMGMIIKNLKEGTCEIVESRNQEDFKRKNTISVMDPIRSQNFKKQQKKIDGIKNEGNSFTVEKKFLQQKMSNISDILTQARGVQINNPDGSLSFKIVDIEAGGVFSYLGIQDNDIITSINGNKINDLNDVMGLFAKITTLDQLNLTITRGGEKVPLEYKFK